ncbi:MAG: hypothetical protein H0U27_06755 [Nitrosopumilus sp.]|nr:hypothetical protein [Nitrosopumilus sp.]
MHNVNLYCIGGIIAPIDTSLPLYQTACGRELESNKTNLTIWSPPEISHEIYSFSLDLLKESLGHEQEPTSSYFWKTRLIHYFALTSICSLTFIPFDLTSDQTLFLQRNITSPPFTGYFASYLSEKKQRKWGCIKFKDCVTHDLDFARDIIPSLHGINSSHSAEIAILLALFLDDPLSAVIGITFKQAASPFAESESYATHCWIKSKQIS